MNQSERRLYLVSFLLSERGEEYRERYDKETERRLLRGLMNVRPPRPVPEEFLQVQDEYLQEETRRKGITDSASFPEGITVWQGDITTLRIDGIVNAANSGLTGCYYPNHGCIDNAIHTYAGVELRLCCDRIIKAQGHEEATGTCKITPAYNLPSRFVLHTVGPIVHGRVRESDREMLRKCYEACLETASENGLQSLAFCCISTGEFHFPGREAAEIAVRTVKAFLGKGTSLKKVVFNVFKDADREIYKGIV